MKTKINNWIGEKPWIWAFLGSLLCWLATSILSSQLGIQSLIINASMAAILAVVALGQMFAISSGDGGIDLSVPYVITLTSFLSFGVINGSNKNLLLGMIVILGVGALIGLLNAGSIIIFGIPPIIATIAMGFIVNTAILVYAPHFVSYKTSSILSFIAKDSILGIPVIIILTVVLALAIAFLLIKTSYGRSIMSVGQNRIASDLAGVKNNRTIIIAYIISGVFAALSGALIGARVGGAFLDMGQPYMMQSVGAVVIGGTLISGGKASVIGTLFGALFLTLMVTLMVVTHLPIGIQYIIEGIILILVLAIGGSGKEEA